MPELVSQKEDKAAEKDVSSRLVFDLHAAPMSAAYQLILAFGNMPSHKMTENVRNSPNAGQLEQVTNILCCFWMPTEQQPKGAIQQKTCS